MAENIFLQLSLLKKNWSDFREMKIFLASHSNIFAIFVRTTKTRGLNFFFFVGVEKVVGDAMTQNNVRKDAMMLKLIGILVYT